MAQEPGRKQPTVGVGSTIKVLAVWMFKNYRISVVQHHLAKDEVGQGQIPKVQDNMDQSLLATAEGSCYVAFRVQAQPVHAGGQQRMAEGPVRRQPEKYNLRAC